MNTVDRVEHSRKKIRATWRASLVILLAIIAALLLWAARAPLHSAAVASGFIRAEGYRKTVQHFDGGIVDRVLVSEGAYVSQGEALITLQTRDLKHSLKAALTNYLNLLTIQQRLAAQVQHKERIEFTRQVMTLAEKTGSVSLLDEQRELLKKHRADQRQQLAIVDSQEKQLNIQAAGHQKSLRSLQQQRQLLEKQRSALTKLAAKNLVSEQQLSELHFTIAGLVKQIDDVQTAQQNNRQRLEELTLSRRQIQTKGRLEALETAQQQRLQIPLLHKEIQLLQAKLERATIAAPISGRIANLNIHTSGATISPASTVMDIVPDSEQLVVEAHLKPEDIDSVYPGGEASVRLTAYNPRRTPALAATVKQLSPDRLMDQRGQAYYAVTLQITDTIGGGMQLYPGMPAEVIIKTGSRTLLDYLLAPLLTGTEKAFREQ